MLPVLIPTSGDNTSDGVAFADVPSLSEYGICDPRDLQADCRVRVVPLESLQALLNESPTFAKFERSLGAVSDRERAQLLGLFALIEEWRSSDRAKREKYFAWTRAKRSAERKEATNRRGQEESNRIAQSLFEHDKAVVERKGPQRTVADLLNGLGTVRIWGNKRTGAPCPGVFVHDFQEALLVLLPLNLADSESFARCPSCKRIFTRTNPTRLFRTAKCGNNDRKQRQRAREQDRRAGGGTAKTE